MTAQVGSVSPPTARHIIGSYPPDLFGRGCARALRPRSALPEQFSVRISGRSHVTVTTTRLAVAGQYSGHLPSEKTLTGAPEAQSFVGTASAWRRTSCAVHEPSPVFALGTMVGYHWLAAGARDYFAHLHLLISAGGLDCHRA